MKFVCLYCTFARIVQHSRFRVYALPYKFTVPCTSLPCHQYLKALQKAAFKKEMNLSRMADWNSRTVFTKLSVCAKAAWKSLVYTVWPFHCTMLLQCIAYEIDSTIKNQISDVSYFSYTFIFHVLHNPMFFINSVLFRRKWHYEKYSLIWKFIYQFKGSFEDYHTYKFVTETVTSRLTLNVWANKVTYWRLISNVFYMSICRAISKAASMSVWRKFVHTK